MTDTAGVSFTGVTSATVQVANAAAMIALTQSAPCFVEIDDSAIAAVSAPAVAAAAISVTSPSSAGVSVVSVLPADVTLNTVTAFGPQGPQGPTGSLGPQGVQGPQGATGSQGVPGGIVLPGRVITSGSSVAMTISDGIVLLASASLTDIYLPSGPTDFQQFFVKDAIGLAGSSPVTVHAPAGNLIDGSATVALRSPYASLTLIHAAGNWSIL